LFSPFKSNFVFGEQNENNERKKKGENQQLERGYKSRCYFKKKKDQKLK
jgi:hypothetical protein